MSIAKLVEKVNDFKNLSKGFKHPFIINKNNLNNFMTNGLTDDQIKSLVLEYNHYFDSKGVDLIASVEDRKSMGISNTSVLRFIISQIGSLVRTSINNAKFLKNNIAVYMNEDFYKQRELNKETMRKALYLLEKQGLILRLKLNYGINDIDVLLVSSTGKFDITDIVDNSHKFFKPNTNLQILRIKIPKYKYDYKIKRDNKNIYNNSTVSIPKTNLPIRKARNQKIPTYYSFNRAKQEYSNLYFARKLNPEDEIIKKQYFKVKNILIDRVNSRNAMCKNSDNQYFIYEGVVMKNKDKKDLEKQKKEQDYQNRLKAKLTKKPKIIEFGNKYDPSIYVSTRIMQEFVKTIPNEISETFTKNDMNVFKFMDDYTAIYKQLVQDYNKAKTAKKQFPWYWLHPKNFNWEFFTTTAKGKRYWTMFKNFVNKTTKMEPKEYTNYIQISMENYKFWPKPIPVANLVSETNLSKYEAKEQFDADDNKVIRIFKETKITSNREKVSHEHWNTIKNRITRIVEKTGHFKKGQMIGHCGPIVLDNYLKWENDLPRNEGKPFDISNFTEQDINKMTFIACTITPEFEIMLRTEDVYNEYAELSGIDLKKYYDFAFYTLGTHQNYWKEADQHELEYKALSCR